MSTTTLPRARRSKQALGVLAGAAIGLGLVDTAGAGVRWGPATATVLPTECVITAQPWDLRSYELVAVHQDGSQDRLLEQDGSHLDPTSWTYPNGEITAVWWAAHTFPADNASDFYDVLPVNDRCEFTTAYAAMPGHRDSVTIEGRHTPPPPTSTTTAPVPSTTAPLAEQSESSQPPTTTTAPPAADVVVPDTTPRAPGTTTTLLEAETLPETGAPTGDLTRLGGALLAGGLLSGVAHRRWSAGAMSTNTGSAVHPDEVEIGDEVWDGGRWFAVAEIDTQYVTDHEDPDGGYDLVSFRGAQGGDLTVAIHDRAVVHAR